MSDHQDYVLGEDITDAAKGHAHRGTAVVSVRMSTDEVGRLEALSRERGVTVSQIVREAVAAYQVPGEVLGPVVTVSTVHGSTLSVGASQETSRGYTLAGELFLAG